MAEWLKECEICNTGLCKEMKYLTDSVEKGGQGLPVREASKKLEAQATKQIGEKVWTAEQIRARYLYHTGQMEGGRNSTTAKERTLKPKFDPEKYTVVCKEGAEIFDTPEEYEAAKIEAKNQIRKMRVARIESWDIPAAARLIRLAFSDAELLNLREALTALPMENENADKTPLFERDKPAFLEFIKRIHSEWCRKIGMEPEEMANDEYGHASIIPSSDLGKETRTPSIPLTINQYLKLMSNNPEPIELRILKAFENLHTDLELPERCIPVPDEVYQKAQDLEQKKRKKSQKPKTKQTKGSSKR